MTRLGYQIPNFTYPGIAAQDIFQNVIKQAQAAEAAGYDRVFVMDTSISCPALERQKNPCSSVIAERIALLAEIVDGILPQGQ